MPHVGASMLLRIVAVVLFVVAFIVSIGDAAISGGALGLTALGLAAWCLGTLVP